MFVEQGSSAQCVSLVKNCHDNMQLITNLVGVKFLLCCYSGVSFNLGKMDIEQEIFALAI